MPVLALPFPAIDPVLFSFGPFAIRWYGLAYLAGILLGWRYSRRLAGDSRLWGTRQPAMDPADIDDFVIWATLGIVLGGRLGYVLFYNFAAYAADPAAILYVWDGGMSFHGGLLGTIVAMTLFAIRRGIAILSLYDVIAAGIPFGLFFGRLANFINGELFGRVADLPWSFVFPAGGPLPRHPSQLYEAALEGIVLFAVLRVLTHRFESLSRPGLTGGVFVAGYGACRIAVEFVREPDAHIGFFGDFVTLGMILSLPMVAIGLGFAIHALRMKAAP